jgi:hypothetical protein
VLLGLLYAVIAAVYLIMGGQNEVLTYRAWNAMGVILADLIMAAGVCTIAAGLRRSANFARWLLVLNGLALCALGLTSNYLVRFPIRFRFIALLIILSAMSMGILELVAGRGWLPRAAGLVAMAFAAAFLALGFQWIQIQPNSHTELLWLGTYFGFSAVSMVCLARFKPIY